MKKSIASIIKKKSQMKFHPRLNYFKFFGGLFINLASHFQFLVMLELLDRHFGIIPEYSIDFQIVAVVDKILAVILKRPLDFLDDCLVFASFGYGFEGRFYCEFYLIFILRIYKPVTNIILPIWNSMLWTYGIWVFYDLT